MSEGFIYHWDLIEQSTAVNELHKALLVWHRNLVTWRDLLEENVVSFVLRQLADLSGLLHLGIVVSFVGTWDLVHHSSSFLKKDLTLNSGTGSDTHILTLFFGLSESMNSKYLPCTGFKIDRMIIKYLRPLSILEAFDSSVRLGSFIGL